MEKGKLYKALFACCDQEKVSVRPALKGIYHELVGDKWILNASDGFVAVRSYLPAYELPESLNGLIKTVDGKTIDERFPLIASVTPKGEPNFKTVFSVKGFTSLVNAVHKESNGIKGVKNRLIINGACLNVVFLKKAIGVMGLYGAEVIFEAYKKLNYRPHWTNPDEPDTYTIYTLVKCEGTETYCLIMPALPFDLSFEEDISKATGALVPKVDYTLDEAKELIKKQKDRAKTPEKSWFE